MQDATSEFSQDDSDILATLKPEGEEAPPSEPDPGQAAAATEPQAEPASPVAAEPAPAAQAAAPVEPAASAAAPAEAPKPEGDVRVALRAARRGEQKARERAEQAERRATELEQQLATAKSQAQPADDDDVVTDEEIEAAKDDLPIVAKLAKTVKRLQSAQSAQVQESAAAPAEPEFEPVALPAAVQEVVDATPDLLAWQHDTDQTAFQAAVRCDALLTTLPGWKDKPWSERALEVVRRVKADLPAPAAPQQPRLDPAQVIASTPTATPTVISDFRGGAQPQGLAPDFSRMTDEEVMASLKPD